MVFCMLGLILNIGVTDDVILQEILMFYTTRFLTDNAITNALSVAYLRHAHIRESTANPTLRPHGLSVGLLI